MLCVLIVEGMSVVVNVMLSHFVNICFPVSIKYGLLLRFPKLLRPDQLF